MVILIKCRKNPIKHEGGVTFSVKNDILTPVTPNDPRLTCDLIEQVEGLKLINMYESYGHI